MRPDLIHTSKFLSLVLRHRPEVIGLALEEKGWVSVKTLLERTNAVGYPLTMERLREVVERNDKQCFMFDPTGARIRAVQVIRSRWTSGMHRSLRLIYSTMARPHAIWRPSVERG